MFIDAIGLLVYAVMLKVSSKYDMGVIRAALITGISPIAINGAYRGIITLIYHKSLLTIFAPYELVTYDIQLLVVFVIFYFLKRNDDSLGVWFIIAALGAFVCYAFVPSVVQQFYGRL